jgi:hypothetical protein
MGNRPEDEHDRGLGPRTEAQVMPGVDTPRRSWRRAAAAFAVVAAIAVVIVIVLASQSPSSATPGNRHNRVSGAATVQRRDLAETDTESGTLSHAHPETVYDRLSGTITWLPAVGELIKPGQTLFKVDGQPVTLLNGPTPAYRTLSSSDSAGPDILELNRALVALGFNASAIVIDDVWQPATTVGVELLQESLGETATGSLALGRVVFLPGDQLVSTVSATLGSTGAPANGSTPAAYRPRRSANSSEFVSLATTTPTTTPHTTTPGAPTPGTGSGHNGPGPGSGHNSPRGRRQPTTVAALIALLKAAEAQLQAEAAQLRAAQSGNHPGGNSGSPSSGNHPGSPSNGNGNHPPSNNPSGSGGGGSPTAVLQTTSTELVATVDLDASKQSEAKVGEAVTVQMPDGSVVNGRITAVSPVAQTPSNSGNGSGSGGSSTPTIPVTIALSGRQRGTGLDQAAVSVNFVQARAHDVLSVPVTALLATGGGGYAVQEAAPPHALVPVTTGLFAAGYVQVSGPGVYAGLQITDSEG